jgi:Icc-related predicted phosphoesterase
MKLYVTSDIHLEFGDIVLENKHNVDVLILSGDICVARDIGRPDTTNIMEGARSNRIRDFFQRVSQEFPHTIFIMGNHEHYHGDFAKSYAIIKNMLADAHLHNVYILEKECKDIDGWTFIGGTLWTDFNGADPQTMHHASWGMSDYHGVKNSESGHARGIWKLIPDATLRDHYRMKDYIRTVLANRRAQGLRDRRIIVVGHHAPSRASTHPRYAHDILMNGCYSSPLDQIILDHPEIVLWTHGHTHEDFDYMIGSTRIVCNPRGYIGHEDRADTWQPKLIELE